jgi:hypothetical protein
MRVLIGQPVHEDGMTQLEIKVNVGRDINIILYPEGYLSSEKVLEYTCKLAKENNIMIITSYRKDNKDRAVIISNTGEKILERAKVRLMKRKR